MTNSGFTFGKKEKLCSQKIIDRLFLKGGAFIAYPLRVQFMPSPLPEDVPVQAMFSVPKKRIKKAVKRNLLKRRMREAYRLNKTLLCDVLVQGNLQMAVAFILVANDEVDYILIEKGMKKALARLITEVKRHGDFPENS